MNDNPNCRPDSAADFARLVGQLYLQGWRLIADHERLAELTGVPGQPAFTAALEALLATLREEVDAAFTRLEEQARASCVPHEAAFAALAQFNSMQDMAKGPLRQIELSWLAALPALAPPLGMFQHKHERLQAMSSALIELRQAQNAYLELIRGAADEAIAGFERLLASQEAPLGLKQIHALWLDAGEQAYERMLQSEAYSVAFAELANASAGVAAQAQDALDDVLGFLKLPTRREMIGAQQRLQELRRRQRASERAMPAELASLRQEMASLRAEMERLRLAAAPTAGDDTQADKLGGKRKRTHAV